MHMGGGEGEWRVGRATDLRPPSEQGAGEDPWASAITLGESPTPPHPRFPPAQWGCLVCSFSVAV